MKKSKWSDKQMEEMIKQLPKIQDDRDPNEIFQAVMIKLKNKRRKRWIVPTLAATTVFILLFAYSGTMMFNKGITSNEAADTHNQSMEIAVNESPLPAEKKEFETFSGDIAKRQAYFIVYSNMESVPLIVPYGSYPTIHDALAAMKIDIEDQALMASIPKTLEFERIDDSQKILKLYVKEDSVFENNQAAINTIEAILLTAKEFDFHSVHIINAPIQQVGEFRLQDEIKIPATMN